jgi:hypothetical protein
MRSRLAPTRCSQPSSTSRVCFPARLSISTWSRGSPGCAKTPAAAATAGSTAAAESRRSSSARYEPSANQREIRAANSSARRVLPTPIGPCRVISRLRCCSLLRKTASSSPRPTNLSTASGNARRGAPAPPSCATAAACRCLYARCRQALEQYRGHRVGCDGTGRAPPQLMQLSVSGVTWLADWRPGRDRSSDGSSSMPPPGPRPPPATVVSAAEREFADIRFPSQVFRPTPSPAVMECTAPTP